MKICYYHFDSVNEYYLFIFHNILLLFLLYLVKDNKKINQ